MEYFKIDRRGRRTDGDGAGRGRGRTDGRIVFLRRNPKHLISSANGWTDGRAECGSGKAGLTHGREEKERTQRREGAPWEVAASIAQTDRQRDAAVYIRLKRRRLQLSTSTISRNNNADLSHSDRRSSGRRRELRRRRRVSPPICLRCSSGRPSVRGYNDRVA